MNSKQVDVRSKESTRGIAQCTVCCSTELIQPFPTQFPQLFECKLCRHVFAYPMPEDSELNRFYAQYPAYGRVSAVTVRRYRELLKSFEDFRKHNRLLEIGCGDGFFLDVARSEGWEVYGTEYNPRSIAVCKSKGIPIRDGEVRPSDWAITDFDVVLSMEVIEHTRDVRHEAAAMIALCRPGGLLYLTTPNFNSISRRILGANWSVICYPEHLQYFNRRSLKKLFNSLGIDTVKVKATGISPGRLLEGLRKKRNPEANKPFVNTSRNEDQVLRSFLDKTGLLSIFITLLNILLSPAGAGDTLKATFLKPEVRHGKS